MLLKFKNTFQLLCKVICFLLNLSIFLLLFGVNNAQLLRPSRTAAITILSFLFVYILMTLVYGGFDIGIKKSKPIIYSMSLCLVTADLAAHLFLCIMNFTVVNEGHFVYEQPWLLVLVMILQIIITSLLTYGCNHLFFCFVPRQRCILISHRNEDTSRLAKSISSFRKQFCICYHAYTDSPDLLNLIDRYECVFLCNLSASERVNIVEYCYAKRKHIYYTLEMADMVSLGAQRVMFGDTSMMFSPPKRLTMEQRILKRTFDIVVSALALVIFSPVFAITAIAIKLEDGGHIFYRQQRATYAGRVFNVIKFRSMREEGSVNVSVIKDDDRITRVGRIIRKYRIDELPQLINILRGDMSLVGPRPERPELAAQYEEVLPEYALRLQVKAGLTGYAQVYGTYDTPPEEKLRMDLWYIAHWSAVLDWKLIIMTAGMILRIFRQMAAAHIKAKDETCTGMGEQVQ